MIDDPTRYRQIASQAPPQQPKTKKGRLPRLLPIIRQALAISFWVYVVTKVFIFDFDIFLLQRFSPDYAWLLNFKFFILIGALASIWLVTKNIDILLWTLYILFYPAIVLLWRLPFFIFRQNSWNLALAFSDAVISFFKSIKFSSVTTSLLLVSLAIIFTSSNEILLWLSIALLLVILFAVYLHRFLMVFKPSGVYQVYSKVFSSLGRFLSMSNAAGSGPPMIAWCRPLIVGWMCATHDRAV